MEVVPAKAVARGVDNADEPREGGQESVVVEKRGGHAAYCKWTIAQFGKVKQRSLWSRYFEVGGYDCRLLVYPKGDSQALPGYVSIYLQVCDPRGNSARWDCFASYRLCVVNCVDPAKSIQRDSWHRFSGKKKSHGWCDFAQASVLVDPSQGFLVSDAVLISAEILVLHESVSFSRENELALSVGPTPEVLSGKFTWKVHNLSLFKEMIKTQKIMSPVFPAGECNLRLSVYQSSVGGVDYLSMCLESKDTEKSGQVERSCWCLFRMSVLNQKGGSGHMHRDSYGRFAADNKSGDNTSLGWNDYMRMNDFLNPETGFLVDDTAVFSASFHIIKESSSFSKNLSPGFAGGRAGGGSKKSDGFQGKFLWRIENFTKLKDLLKKRKITGLCIKSRRFQVGNRDCRLIVYPRGQSQPPMHLSMFLEVTDPRSAGIDWSCFVSHRLSVVNQKADDRSVNKESQNRYSKAAKDWGWREFITLTALFDQDSGFLVNDTVVFSAEVLILKETAIASEPPPDLGLPAPGGWEGGRPAVLGSYRGLFTWRVENFLAFKEIMETRKIFSKFFQAGGVELRIGVYESFDTLCIYLESDAATVAADLDKNYWVRYRIAVMNQKHPERTVWKESSICTRTWNNSVLQFMKVSDMLDPDAGFVVREAVVFTCEVLDCCPWMEFADLEVFLSDDEPDDALSTDPDDFLDSDDSEDGFEGDDEDLFRTLLARTGFHLGNSSDGPPALLLDPMQLQAALQERLLMDPSSVGAFLTGLRLYLDEPGKLKRLLMPTKLPGMLGKGRGDPGEYSHPFAAPSLIDLLMGVKVLQQDVLDLLLDIMVVCCTPQRGGEEFRASAEGVEPPVAEATEPWPFWADQRGQVTGGGEAPSHSRHHGGRGLPDAEPPQQLQHVRFGAGEGAVVDERFTVRGDSECVRSDAARAEMTSSSVEPGPPVLNSGLKHAAAAQPSVSAPRTPPRVNTPPQASDASAVESVTPDDVSESSSLDPSHAVPASELDAPPEPDSGSGPLPAHAEPLPNVRGGGAHHRARSSWQDESEELLGLIVNALRQLDGMMPHHAGLGEPQDSGPRRPHSAQKVELVLDRAPHHLLPDLIALAPKMVERDEHVAIAASLVGRLSSPETDLSLRLPLLASVSHLEVGAEAWEQVLAHGLELMQVLNDDESLAATISFVLKAAADSGNLPAAAYAIRTKLKRLGPAIPPLVLDVIRSTVCLRADVASALLHDVDSDEERASLDSVNGRAAAAAAQAAHSMMFGADVSGEVMFADGMIPDMGGGIFGGDPGAALAAAQATAAACWRIADVDILLEMLTVPALRLEAQRVFECAISRGVFGDQAVAVVLERRRSQRLILDLRLSVAPPVGGSDGQAGAPPEDDDFPAVLALAEALAASKDARAREYVSTLYSIMFKVYGDESSRERMLRGIVDRACSSCRDSGKPSPDADLGLDVLSFVVREEDGAARPALTMLRQAVESAHAERAALARQLAGTEEELGKLKANKAGEIQRLTKERADLQAKLAEAEQTAQKAKAEAKTESERVRREGKEGAERVRELEGQLEWVRSEREEEVQALKAERKALEQRAREAEAQLAQIKSRKKDELKRVMKEKNVLAERLKTAETSRQKFDEEMKRVTSETVGKDELRKTLENEVRRLNSRMGQTETGLREKEEQILRCEAYIDGMEAKLHAHQDYIQTLEASLQEEMQRHAPLYGAGLEALSLSELSTLERIHDEGLKQVRALQQQRSAPSRPGSGHGPLPNGSAGLSAGGAVVRPIGAEMKGAGGGRPNGIGMGMGGMSQGGGMGGMSQGGGMGGLSQGGGMGGMSQAGGLGGMSQAGGGAASLFGGVQGGGHSRAVPSSRSMSPALPNGGAGNGAHMNGNHVSMNSWFQPV